MSIRVVDRIDGWDEHPFRGGFDGLRDLADEEFSGVVRAGGVELYATVGTIVGVERGTIEDVEGTSGTALEAPHPALPLLAVMQEAGADVRAQYYTEDTPISEVDRTLSGGGFTGYLELSENVLSGDYFLAYHGGESMSVAFVGESERLITDDEAFETADDEVGIYKVRQVDVEPIEIPSRTDGEAGAAGETGAAAASGTSTRDESTTAAPEDDEAAGDDTGTEADATATESSTGATAGADDAVEAQDAGTTAASATGGATAGDGSAGRQAAEADRNGGSTPESNAPESNATAGGAEAADAGAGRSSATADSERTDQSSAAEASSGQNAAGGSTGVSGGTETGRPDADGADAGGTGAADAGGTGTTDAGARTEAAPDRGTVRESHAGGGTAQTTGGGATGEDSGLRSSGGQAGDLETRAIPSLDPDQTKVPSREERSTLGGVGGQTAGGAVPSAETGGGQEPGQPVPESEGTRAATGSRAEPGAGSEDGRASETPPGAEGDLASLDAEVDRLEAELAEATEERDDLRAQLEAVREERDELQAEVERLDSELRRLEEEFGAASDADRRVTPAEAMDGTNLFVDYDSKGDPTLEKAHGGSESQEEVGENLQIGVHTEFDQQSVAVGGQAFGEFLEGTLHYRFAEWVIGNLLFEIRDTGHADALTDLYDAIPEIRRVEFNGTVDVEYVEDGQEKTSQEDFDVIFRHRMGDPLVVANLNDARDPATGGMMDTLVTAAERVGQTEDALAAAFLVTSSFFESEALETVSEATRGGILSRDSRTSFVNLSRKTGYHLCLTAAREGNFHMEVPEL